MPPNYGRWWYWMYFAVANDCLFRSGLSFLNIKCNPYLLCFAFNCPGSPSHAVTSLPPRTGTRHSFRNLRWTFGTSFALQLFRLLPDVAKLRNTCIVLQACPLTSSWPQTLHNDPKFFKWWTYFSIRQKGTLMPARHSFLHDKYLSPLFLPSPLPIMRSQPLRLKLSGNVDNSALMPATTLRAYSWWRPFPHTLPPTSILCDYMSSNPSAFHPNTLQNNCTTPAVSNIMPLILKLLAGLQHHQPILKSINWALDTLGSLYNQTLDLPCCSFFSSKVTHLICKTQFCMI